VSSPRARGGRETGRAGGDSSRTLVWVLWVALFALPYLGGVGPIEVILWLLLFVIYIRMLWRLIRQTTDFSRGLALGALGGAVGFFTSGVVHYNWGDSEVIMVFYLIMGLALVVQRIPAPVSQTVPQRESDR